MTRLLLPGGKLLATCLAHVRNKCHCPSTSLMARWAPWKHSLQSQICTFTLKPNMHLNVEVLALSKVASDCGLVQILHTGARVPG
eukprot:1157780-Pelagomonas_calceolata.AAC.6